MKNFLKIFCVIVMCFVSLAAGANEDLSTNTDKISSVELVIYPSDNETENAISSSNYYNAEIISLSGQKQTYNCSTLYKASAQARLIAQIFAQNYNRVLLSKSHKISNILRNEICTRAP